VVENAHTYPMPLHVTVLRFLSKLLGRTAIVCAALSGLLVIFGIALEEDALSLEYDIASGLDAYLRMAMGVIALGGGFGVAIVLAFVHDLYRRAQRKALDRIVEDRDWLSHLARDPASRSKTSVCLSLEGADEARIKRIAALLESEDVAYDIAGYRDAPPGLRIWCGATVDGADIEALGPWLDWAWAQTA